MIAKWRRANMAISTAAHDRSQSLRRIANAVSTTEIMIAEFYKKGHLTLRLGQLLMDNLRHPRFDPKDLRSETIVHLLRRFERPFKETVMHTYNLWMEGDGNQRLDFVVRDYL